MLELSEQQIQFIENNIYDVFNTLSEEEQEAIENSDDEDEEIRKLQYANFERLKTSEELHYLIKNWNDGYEIPKRVLHHEMCDRGTALMIYWLATPDYFTQFKSAEDVENYNRDNYYLVKEAENLLLTDHYSLQKIKFNPKSVASWEAIDDEGIPSQLKTATDGEEFTF
ncbi:hypothetical protein GCM10027592_53460 [Spirosoma flavus]